VGFRCLIVDDSERFLASAARLLEAQGMQIVACASSSSEAMRLAETLELDVVLVDIELGEESGLTLAQELVARHPSLNVVLISARERNELADLIATSPAAGFLTKSALSAAAIACLLP
jgi:DNA-binding NarL/FixJ family response regulator